MAERIINWGAALPREFRGKENGDIEALGMKKLFRGIILSPSGGGKTNLVFHIVKNAPNVFSHLHLIARNPDQELYNYMKEKLQGFITIYDPNVPPSLDSIQMDPAGGIQLVIIDDYSSDAKYQKELFSHFFIRGRHKKLSTLFLTHSYFATNKLIRLNTEYLFILRANSSRDLRMIVGDFTLEGMSVEKLMKAYQEATRERGQFLLIDNVRSILRYNFSKEPVKIE